MSRAPAARETSALIDAGVARLAGMLGFDWHALPTNADGEDAFAKRLFQLTFNEDFSNLPDVRCAAWPCAVLPQCATYHADASTCPPLLSIRNNRCTVATRVGDLRDEAYCAKLVNVSR